LYRADFGPFTPGFEIVPFGDLDSVEKAIDGDTAAVLLEPIQAEAGILIPPVGYLKDLRELCSQKKVLMMTDEIQTGLGRTGRDFASQHEDVTPDINILGKSLGGGLLPLSAIVSNWDVMEVIEPGEHGSTFGGNPLACAAALAVINTIEKDQLLSNAAEQGSYLLEELKNKLSATEGVREIRGVGLMIGIELEQNCTELVNHALQEGLLISVQAENVVRLLPPIILSKAQADTITTKVSALITAWLQKEAA